MIPISVILNDQVSQSFKGNKCHSLLVVLTRDANGKQPLVSFRDRSERRGISWNIKRVFLRVLFSFSGAYVAFKWRWCRGEIRERRKIAEIWKRMAMSLGKPRYGVFGTQPFATAHIVHPLPPASGT